MCLTRLILFWFCNAAHTPSASIEATFLIFLRHPDELSFLENVLVVIVQSIHDNKNYRGSANLMISQSEGFWLMSQ